MPKKSHISRLVLLWWHRPNVLLDGYRSTSGKWVSNPNPVSGWGVEKYHYCKEQRRNNVQMQSYSCGKLPSRIIEFFTRSKVKWLNGFYYWKFRKEYIIINNETRWLRDWCQWVKSKRYVSGILFIWKYWFLICALQNSVTTFKIYP